MASGNTPVVDGPRIALVVLSHNSEATIQRCIASVAAVAHSILVVDSHSTDSSVDVARRHGARVLQRPFTNYSDQRNWASSQVDPSATWILHLDADEYLTPALGIEILQAVAGADTTAGFLMRRRVRFLGRDMRYGGMQGIWHLRLYRVNRGWCEDRRYDQHFIVSGATRRLREFFVDDTASTLERWTTAHNGWSSAEAEEFLHPSASKNTMQARLGGSPIARTRWLKQYIWNRLPLLWRPFVYFAYRYFLRLGFLDGREGLVFHCLQGFWFRFLVDSKIIERKSANQQPGVP